MVENNPESNKQLNSITINAQYIKDVSFEAPNVPAVFMEKGAAPEISVNVDVQAGKVQDNLFEVALKVTANAKVKEKTAFLCEVEYACLATISLPPENLEPVLLIEVPRLLFPFARNIIADLTRESGFPPLLINPIDFVGLYHQRLAEIAKQKEKEKMN